jgi:hypothetical protein
MTMTAKHKKFILKELIPFIMREEGRGLGMNHWVTRALPGTIVQADGLERLVPVCGSVSCVAGSIAILKEMVGALDDDKIGELIGLDYLHSEGLFNGWHRNLLWDYGWPPQHQEAFALAKTPLAKAKVTCQVLRLVAKTNGKCLEPQPNGQKTRQA